MHILQHSIRDQGNERGGDLRPLQFFQMGLTLTSGHSLRIESHHLVGKAFEPPLPCLGPRGVKRARSIAWHGQLQGSLIRFDRVGTRVITDIAVLSLMTGMRNIPELIGQSRRQRTFHHPFR